MQVNQKLEIACITKQKRGEGNTKDKNEHILRAAQVALEDSLNRMYLCYFCGTKRIK